MYDRGNLNDWSNKWYGWRGRFDINQGLEACMGPEDPSNRKKYPKNSVKNESNS